MYGVLFCLIRRDWQKYTFETIIENFMRIFSTIFSSSVSSGKPENCLLNLRPHNAYGVCLNELVKETYFFKPGAKKVKRTKSKKARNTNNKEVS